MYGQPLQLYKTLISVLESTIQYTAPNIHLNRTDAKLRLFSSNASSSTIAPALAGGQAGPHYYGFVTGGRTPISLVADCLVSNYDQNVQVHLPDVTIATEIETIACDLVLDLLGIPTSGFPGRTITTGATSSNILGLALGRQHAVSQIKGPDYSVAEDGFGGVEVDIYAADAHASIRKAAAIVGIGRSKVKEITSQDEGQPAAFDMQKLEQAMKKSKEAKRGIIVCPSYGEVNTGAFTPNMPKIRKLCDTYGAWLHLDAAFGAFGVLHPDFESEVRAGLQLADSLTLDAHKWLNVPYDCALFFTKDTQLHAATCGPGGLTPAYLNAAAASPIPSPLNVRLENSARFRALPLYASLVCYGKEGYREIVQRNIAFARRIEGWLQDHSQYYDVLTPRNSSGSSENGKYKTLNIVLFAPSAQCGVPQFEGENGGQEMVKAINASGEIYVTGTKWKGRSGARLAVSNWMTGRDGSDTDFELVVGRLKAIMGVSRN